MFPAILWRFLMLETLRNCSYDHPQKQFCSSEFVIMVKLNEYMNRLGFRMKIIKVVKGNAEELNSMDNRHVNVRMAKKYNVMDGNKFFIFGRNEKGNTYSEICKKNTPSDIASTLYKRRLVNLYKTGCNCINQMPKYTPDMICHWKYSFLVRRRGNCGWERTYYFRLSKELSKHYPFELNQLFSHQRTQTKY